MQTWENPVGSFDVRRLLVLTLLAVGTTITPATAARRGAETLLRIVTPNARETIPAHPWVNVIVRFGSAANGIAADPDTFRARLGRKDVTQLFEDLVEDGAVVGKRAALRNGIATDRRGGRNQVRLKVRSAPFRGKRRLRDADRVRFAAFTATNQPPHARASITSDVVLPDVLTQLDASASEDPEQDALTYRWDFGDGTPISEEARPGHRFPDLPGNLMVTLVVDDGQAQDAATLELFECPPVCEGCTRGRISVDVAAPLEFASVAAGTTSTATFTVTNVDSSPTSQLHVRLGSGAWPPNGGEPGVFTLTPGDLTLGPGEHGDVTVQFAPNATGHRGAVVPIVACADNQRICLRGARVGRFCSLDQDCGAADAEVTGACGGFRVEWLLAHGFGGNAPGRGPTLATEPLFYVAPEVINGEVPVTGILPSGLQFQVDNRLRACAGLFGLDICTKDSDCLGGGGCLTTGTCTRGERISQPCTYHADCPGGACSAQGTLDPTDMCADGTGTLYLINEDSATDPVTFDSRGTVARLQLDPETGARLAADVLYHPAMESIQIACDGLAAGSRGRLYVPEYHEIDEPVGCQRDEFEALASVSKATGGTMVPAGFRDINTAAGYPECEVFENVEDIHASRDGSAIFVSLPLTGLSRILPKPPLVMVPDFFGNFEVHPDGSVVFLETIDRGTTGLIRVFKVSVAQAQQGALKMSELTPCVTVEMPNGGGRTAVGELAVGRARTDSDDATIVVTFYTVFPTDSPPPVSNPRALPRGTVAISSPEHTSSCSILGLLNLELLTRDQMTF